MKNKWCLCYGMPASVSNSYNVNHKNIQLHHPFYVRVSTLCTKQNLKHNIIVCLCLPNMNLHSLNQNELTDYRTSASSVQFCSILSICALFALILRLSVILRRPNGLSPIIKGWYALVVLLIKLFSTNHKPCPIINFSHVACFDGVDKLVVDVMLGRYLIYWMHIVIYS